jgi:selT/selW/selH-like putative selenoprotein
VEAELKASYPGSQIELKVGGAGVFDVKCDGTLIYSKKNIEGQRFPHEGEVTRLIKEKVG